MVRVGVRVRVRVGVRVRVRVGLGLFSRVAGKGLGMLGHHDHDGWMSYHAVC